LNFIYRVGLLKHVCLEASSASVLRREAQLVNPLSSSR